MICTLHQLGDQTKMRWAGHVACVGEKRMQWFDIVVVGRCYLHVFVYRAHLSVCPLCSHLSPYLTFLFLKLRKIKRGITYVHFFNI